MWGVISFTQSSPNVCFQEASAGGVAPSEYFLAAFEKEVKYTRTKDPAVIEAALNELTATGDFENLYTAAQMVLVE